MQTSFRGILVGCGHMGQIHLKHLEAQRIPILAVDGEKNCIQSLKSADHSPDFALIATPASTHYNYVKIALEQGLNVFVEKPLALSVLEANELTSLAESRQKLLFVGHSERYNPAFQKFLSEFIHNSKTAKLSQLTFTRKNKPSERGRDVSTVWDIGVHDFDLLHELQQATPNVDWSAVQVTFDESREATEQCRKIDAVFCSEKTFTLHGNLDLKIDGAADSITNEHADFFRLLKMPAKERNREMQKQLAGALFAVQEAESSS